MSDLREFGGRTEPAIGTGFAPRAQADYSAERIDLSAEGLDTTDIRPLNETSDMGAFRTVEPESESTTGKAVAVFAVALILGGVGAAGYLSSMKSSTSGPAIAAAAPQQQIAAAPPPAPVSTPADNTPSTAAPVDTADAGQGMTRATQAPETQSEAAAKPSSPVRTARVDVTPQRPVPPVAAQPAQSPQPANPVMTPPAASPVVEPQQQQAVVPEPVSPAAPASSMAANTPASGALIQEQSAQDQAQPEQAQQPSPDVQALNQPAQAEQGQALQPETAQPDAQPDTQPGAVQPQPGAAQPAPDAPPVQ